MTKVARKRSFGAAAVIFFVVLAFWSRTWNFDFVEFDDNDYVTANEHVLGGLTPANMRWAWCSAGYAANWHPLTWMSLQLDATLCAESEKFPGVVHLHNAALHAANAALLFLLLLALQAKGSRQPDGPPVAASQLVLSALLALIWAVHPLRAEAVAWVSERKEVLSCFFMLLTLLFHVGGAAHDRRGMGGLFALYACYALALAAKPVAVSLPAVMFAIDVFLLGRVRWGRFGVCSMMAAGCVVLTIVAQRGAMPGMYIPFKWRIPNALASMYVYFKQTWVPTGLAAYYPFELTIDWWRTAAGMALAVGCGYWAFRGSLGLLALAWIGVGLLPMLGILQVGGQAHADRYTYWVGCGAVAVIGVAVTRAGLCARRVAPALCCLSLVAYGVWGWRQMGMWRNDESLYEGSYAAVPSGWAANGLGDVLARRGDMAGAERLYREAAAFSRNDESLAKLACFLSAKPPPVDFGEIYALCVQAETLDASNWQIYEARGVAMMRERRFAEAAKELERAMKAGSTNDMIAKMLKDARKLSAPGPVAP